MAKRPSQKRLFRELAEKYGLEVAQAFMAAVRDITRQVEVQKLILALERRDLEAAMQALHIDRAAFQPLEAKLVEAFTAGGQGAVASMPAAVSIGFRFDPGNQRAAAIIRERAARLITGLIDTEIQQAREILADGMARGAGPRSVALDLVGLKSRATGNREGGLIGLTPGQRKAVAKARAELASGDPALMRLYLKRGRRFRYPYDNTIKRAISEGRKLKPEFIDGAIRGYRASLLKYRGEIIARTEGLPAIRAAKHEAYQQLADDGRVDVMDIVRGWSTTTDGRERETHGAMNGQEVRGLDAPFVSPSGARFRYPGDSSLGAPLKELAACRCDEFIAIRRRWPL
jgi:hypothetical protein